MAFIRRPFGPLTRFLLGVIGLAGPVTTATAADWGVNTADDGTVFASAVARVTTAKGSAYTILNVGFARATCSPEVGFAILTSRSYGDVIGRYPGNQSLTITVDDQLPRLLSTKAIKYSNGFENMASADSTLLAALSGSQEIRVKLLDDFPTFLMETRGAGAAISRARAACLARR
jgi:hypothetical protein